MHVVIERTSPTPIYLQISQQLRQSILDGEPPSGAKLPPERRLAKLLGVNRTTIVNAYRELAADGLISGQVGRGTVVIFGARDADAAADVTAWPRVNGQHPLDNGASTLDGDFNDGSTRSRQSSVPWAQLFTAVTDVMDDPLLRDAMTVSARP
ncbi:MAG: winged helix-turn-helix domain-containing protein, partial [Thermomicrobiales bacterium]